MLANVGSLLISLTSSTKGLLLLVWTNHLKSMRSGFMGVSSSLQLEETLMGCTVNSSAQEIE